MEKSYNLKTLICFLLFLMLIFVNSSKLYATAPDLHISASTINVVEGDSTKVTVWVGGLTENENRSLLITVTPPSLFDSTS